MSKTKTHLQQRRARLDWPIHITCPNHVSKGKGKHHNLCPPDALISDVWPSKEILVLRNVFAYLLVIRHGSASPGRRLIQRRRRRRSGEPYSSATRWRHEESGSFARHAAHQGRHHGSGAHQVARDAEARSQTNDLADFLNASRVPQEEINGGDGPSTPRFKPIMAGASEAREAASGDRLSTDGAQEPADGKEIVCGPLLNYRRMEDDTWFGSVLVVIRGGGKEQAYVPSLEIRRANGANGDRAGALRDGDGAAGSGAVQGICLYSESRNTFWRFDLSVLLGHAESQWEYTLPGLRFASKEKPQPNRFFVPAVTESMRIMFHSCNGFSVGTDEDAWSGPALWNDVLRRHREAPFHVMIGGGDQIYNDGIRVSGPLREWTAIGNPKKRREFPFPESLRADCDNYYLKNYIRWYA